MTLKTGRIFTRNLNALIAVQQKFLNQTQTIDSDAITIRTDQESLVGDYVEKFRRVNLEYMRLS